MNERGRKHWYMLIVALVLVVGGSLLARFINMGAGTATIQDVKIFGTNGYTVSGYLYVPKSVNPKKPGPGILAFHGLNNQKNYMSNTALELARRGFVVLSADMAGHGYSNGGNGQNAHGGIDALKYLRSLPIVDKSNIGLVGMSQGGFGPVTAAAKAIPDGYNSIFYMESECTAPGNQDPASCQELKNVAFNIGSFTELGGMVMVAKGSDVPTSPVVQPIFGTKEPIKPNQIYGSIKDGTARILYQPWEEHAMSTDSPAAIRNTIDWMQKTLVGQKELSPSDQIWGWKVFGTAAALLGAVVFMFTMGALLLRTAYFGSLVEPMPVYKGFTGIGWWVGALITTAVGPLLYFWVWMHMLFNPWVPPNTLWPQSFTNIYMVWAAIVGIIAIILILINHYAFTKKKGATISNYGLASEGKGIDWGKVKKSLVLAVTILLPLYLLLAFINGAWRVDFRAWVVALMPMSPDRFHAFLAYLIPFAIYFIPQSIVFAAFLRVKGGKASLWWEMIANAIMLTLGALVWILILYIPLIAGRASQIGTPPVGPMVAGMAGIYYIPLLVLWPLVTFLYTYFFRKTGRVYTGAFLVTLFMVWYLAAFGVFAVAP